MKVINLQLLIIFSLFSSACVVNLPSKTDISYGCISAEPGKNEVVGTWVADKSTLEDMATRGEYDWSVIPKLILHEDGKLEAINMPDWWSDGSGKSYRSFEPSFTGTWKFSKYKDSSCLEIVLNLPTATMNMSLGKSRFGQEPKYVITKYIGDPDLGDIMVFVRES